MKRYGGIGQPQHGPIREANSSQVAIYLDGVPLSDAKFGETNLEDLPLDNVERIEVYRGFTPVGFGSAAMGGVVNIVTKKARSRAVTSVSAGYGSYDTWKGSAERSESLERLRYAIFTGASGSDGDYRYKNDNGTPVVNKSDDFWCRRKNNDNTSFSGTGSIGYAMGGLDLLFMNDSFYKEQGLPAWAAR